MTNHAQISLNTPLSSWMSAVDSNRALSQMTIMGTHDSCAIYEIVGIGKCQTLRLAEQLKLGARYLDIRCYVKNGSFEMHHSIIDERQSFDDVMQECLGFLSDNPSETIFMRIKQEQSSASDPEFMNIFNGKYGHYQTSMLFVDTRISPGRLGEARGKITVVSNVKPLPGIRWDDLKIQDDDEQDDHAKKWNLIETLLNDAASYHNNHEDQYYLNSFNAHDPMDLTSSIKDIAQYTKNKFMNYIEQAPVSPCYYGLLPVDFIDLYSEDDMKRILYYNN